MTAIWPLRLPQAVLADGYSRDIDDARLFTQMDAGIDKSRVRGVVGEEIACQIEIHVSLFATFRRFWTETIGKGVLPFRIRDQDFDGLPLADQDGTLLLDQDGNVLLGAYSWLVIFGKTRPRKTTVQGDNFLRRISFTLLVLP